MKIDVNERNENALLEREEITLSVDHTGEATPSENALRKQVSAELDLDPLTVQVDHIYSPAGAARSTAQVTVFEEPIMDELPEDEPAEEAEAPAGDAAEQEDEASGGADEDDESGGDTDEEDSDAEEAEQEEMETENDEADAGAEDADEPEDADTEDA